MHLTNPSVRAGCDTRSIFKRSLTGFNFPSPRSVAIPRLKSSDCPTIYPLLEGEFLDSYLSQRVLALSEM